MRNRLWGITITPAGDDAVGPPAEPITASWSSKPDEHDGTSPFDLHLDFSRALVKFSYRAIAGGVVRVAGGRISRVWRRVKGQNDQWGVEVTPSGTDEVTVSVRHHGLRGARADEDYTAASGTLTFAANETTRTVSVTVLDDAHDEGEETLTLRLSNASGSQVADGEATGTIENRDPLPRALLARFGRTAAVHVVEHFEERVGGAAGAGLSGPFRGPGVAAGHGARRRARLREPARRHGRRQSARRRRGGLAGRRCRRHRSGWGAGVCRRRSDGGCRAQWPQRWALRGSARRGWAQSRVR